MQEPTIDGVPVTGELYIRRTDSGAGAHIRIGGLDEALRTRLTRSYEAGQTVTYVGPIHDTRDGRTYRGTAEILLRQRLGQQGTISFLGEVQGEPTLLED